VNYFILAQELVGLEIPKDAPWWVFIVSAVTLAVASLIRAFASKLRDSSKVEIVKVEAQAKSDPIAGLLDINKQALEAYVRQVDAVGDMARALNYHEGEEKKRADDIISEVRTLSTAITGTKLTTTQLNDTLLETDIVKTTLEEAKRVITLLEAIERRLQNLEDQNKLILEETQKLRSELNEAKEKVSEITGDYPQVKPDNPSIQNSPQNTEGAEVADDKSTQEGA